MPILVLIIVWGGFMAAYFNPQLQSVLNFAEKISGIASNFTNNFLASIISLF